MLSIALLASIALLVIGTAFILAKAPPPLRITAVVLIAAGSAVGAVGGYLVASDGFTREYYPIAGAFVGWIIGAAIYDGKRKRAVRAGSGAPPPRAG